MTDTEKLKEKIRASGYKIGFIAEQMGLSRQGLYHKINDRHEFTTGEVQKLCNILGIDSLEERSEIFFATTVDK